MTVQARRRVERRLVFASRADDARSLPRSALKGALGARGAEGVVERVGAGPSCEAAGVVRA